MSARTSWIRATVLHCDGEWGTYHDGQGRLDLCGEHRVALSANLGRSEELPARGVDGQEYRFDILEECACS